MSDMKPAQLLRLRHGRQSIRFYPGWNQLSPEWRACRNSAAVAAGARWIRVFEFVGAYISYTGLTEGIGGSLARYRKFLDANDIYFLCDVNVKHGSHFIVSDRQVNELAIDAQEQGADALIITGFETGTAPDEIKVRDCKKTVSLPILLGSGVTLDNADSYWVLPMVRLWAVGLRTIIGETLWILNVQERLWMKLRYV